MNFTYRHLVALAAVTFSMIIAGCGSDQSDSKGSFTLGVAVKDDLTRLPIAAAEKQGIFTDFGLDIDLAYFQGASELVQAMAGGEVNYGWTSFLPVANAAATGSKIRMVAAGPQHLVGWGLIVRDDSPLKDVTDLQSGTKISYTSEGSVTNWLAVKSAELANLQESQVTGVPLGGSLPTITKALDDGQVDASVVLLPWGASMTKDGTRRWIMKTDENMPELVAGGIAATEQGQKNEVRTKCLVGAYVEAVRWLKQNPAEAKTIMTDEFDIDNALVDQLYKDVVSDFSTDGSIDLSRVTKTLKQFSSIPGYLDEDVAATDIVKQSKSASKEDCAS